MANKINTDCLLVDSLLTKSHLKSGELPPAAAAHLDTCLRCRELVRALDFQEKFSLPEEALRHLQQPILDHLKPVRPLPPAVAFLALFSVLFLLLAGFGVSRLGSYGWEVLTILQKTVVFTSLAASAALLTFSTVRQMVPGSKHQFSPGLLPISLFVLLALAIAAVFQYQSDPQFLRAGMGCLGAGIPYAIPAALLFWFILRRGALLHPYLAGATSGMLAGLIGTSVLEVHCPILDLAHIVVWHLGVCIAGIGTGLLAAFLGNVAAARSSTHLTY